MISYVDDAFSDKQRLDLASPFRNAASLRNPFSHGDHLHCGCGTVYRFPRFPSRQQVSDTAISFRSAQMQASSTLLKRPHAGDMGPPEKRRKLVLLLAPRSDALADALRSRGHAIKQQLPISSTQTVRSLIAHLVSKWQKVVPEAMHEHNIRLFAHQSSRHAGWGCADADGGAATIQDLSVKCGATDRILLYYDISGVLSNVAVGSKREVDAISMGPSAAAPVVPQASSAEQENRAQAPSPAHGFEFKFDLGQLQYLKPVSPPLSSRSSYQVDWSLENADSMASFGIFRRFSHMTTLSSPSRSLSESPCPSFHFSLPISAPPDQTATAAATTASSDGQAAQASSASRDDTAFRSLLEANSGLLPFQVPVPSTPARDGTSNTVNPSFSGGLTSLFSPLHNLPRYVLLLLLTSSWFSDSTIAFTSLHALIILVFNGIDTQVRRLAQHTISGASSLVFGHLNIRRSTGRGSAPGAIDQLGVRGYSARARDCDLQSNIGPALCCSGPVRSACTASTESESHR